MFFVFFCNIVANSDCYFGLKYELNCPNQYDSPTTGYFLDFSVFIHFKIHLVTSEIPVRLWEFNQRISCGNMLTRAPKFPERFSPCFSQQFTTKFSGSLVETHLSAPDSSAVGRVPSSVSLTNRRSLDLSR